MRKLTRKNLDELAKVMPVISEVEQATYNGGTVYCDLSGHYLGKVGMGDDLKFISSTDFEYYQTNNIEGGGKSFGELDNNGRVHFIMNNSSFERGQISIRNDSDSGYAAIILEQGMVVFKNDSAWNNYHDALSTLEHEWYHFKEHHYEANTGIEHVRNEIETYLMQINSAGFSNTSYEYKKRVAEDLYHYYTENGVNVSLDVLYRLVGI